MFAPHGLGISLRVDADDVLVVRGFNRLSDGRVGPAQECGLILPGDYLIEVNGVSLSKLSLQDVSSLLKSIDMHGEVGRRVRGERAVLVATSSPRVSE